jgi:putative spermidine/putrescine transport system substrate-binding protein
MKRWVYCVMVALVCTACGAKQPTAFDPLRAPWDEVLTEASGKTVHLAMWGGSEAINAYVDRIIVPRVKQTAGVTIKRVPIDDAKDVVNKLLLEKSENKTTGTIDIVWINGENFRTAKTNGALFGPFAAQLPNVQQHVDMDAPDIAYDFGLATDGYEAPWGKAQFVFIYDQAKIPEPPKSMEQLRTWVRANPGMFTYPAPPDFNGSAFIRQALYEVAGGHEPFLQETMDAEKLSERAQPLWAYLNDIEPFLWRAGSTYPENIGKLDALYASGEVWMSMGYDPARAANLIKNNTFPKTTRTFVLDQGTLANTHYLAVPFNAPHHAAAMVAINEMLSPEAQIAKFDPANWGEDMALDATTFREEQQAALKRIDRGEATLSSEVLAKHRVPEMRGDLVPVLEEGWKNEVARK